MDGLLLYRASEGKEIYHFYPVPKWKVESNHVIVALVGGDELVERHAVEIVVDELV